MTMADEYIRRDDFIQHLEKCKKGAAVTNLVWAAIMAIERDVRDMPAADVAPVVHAQWIEDESGIIICPECKRGYNLIAKFTNYCPACGAKMDGKEGANADNHD